MSLLTASPAPKLKDLWDKIDIVGRLLGSILIPVGLAVTGYLVNSALAERQAKEKTAEIAVSILQSKDSSTPELKAWARGVFNATLASADQPLSAKAEHELATKPLPAAIPNSTTGSALPKPAMDIVAKAEGLSHKPYQDASGVWTIGYGHVAGVTAHTAPITEEQARQLLEQDLTQVSRDIDSLVKVKLTINQKSALIGLVRQIGKSDFASSNLLKAINSKKFKDVPAGFMEWNWVMIDGKRVEVHGLTALRQAQIVLWNTPDAKSSPATTPPP
jgi:lysozyme